jgi:hypothetical protein
MTEYKAGRTLVKSAPELWSEVSEASSLGRHLDQFGEIRITRLEPETAVAWEGESARGTVKLEPSGWGTKVILTAQPVPEETAEADAGSAPSSGEIEAEIRELRAVLELGKPIRTRRIFRREGGLTQAFLRWLRGDPVPLQSREEAPPPVSEGHLAGETDDPLGSAAAPALALNSALDSLGRAHHRPYSRA